MKTLIGKKFPDFSLEDQYGIEHTPQTEKGKMCVFYFYPKDMTPGCTVEAETFNELYAKFKKLNVEILGVSADTVKSHEKFCDKYGLGFPLLSDVDKKLISAVGVWVEKSMYGKKYMGIERSTILVDEDGYVIKQYEKVNPNKHPGEILEDIKAIRKEEE